MDARSTDDGRLAFDTVKLATLSAPITARPNQYHKLTAQVSGQLNSANDGRLFVQYSDGTIPTMWQNTGVFNGSQNIIGNFTTPATVSSFQVGTEVVLDNGRLAFEDLTLTAYSDLINVEGGGWYQLDVQITGEVQAGVGQGGRVLLLYNTQPNTPLTAWQNPANFSGTVMDNSLFIPSQNTTQMFILLETKLDAGHLAFSDFDLEHLAAGDIIQRSTYSVAGQSIAVKVEGDPEPDNNGLFFTYSDHLGSTSAMQHPDGSVTQTRYLPFGGYRSGGSNPITDRGFTGHKQNDSLGLIYMNARYYSPTINRFVSADTIVPDPQNPQSYNRYTYVNNSPLTFVDPSGHRSCTTEEAAGGDETCSQNYTEWSAEDENYDYWQTRAEALEYYWANFRYPFGGNPYIASRFGPDHPDGADLGGQIAVVAPASGVVTRAGLDAPAGMWQIENIETGDVLTFGKGILRDRDRLFNPDGSRSLDGLLQPERLLATGEWRDKMPEWSHTRGTVINIDHGHHLQTRYYHLAIDDTSIPVGTMVNQGDPLAVTANNGWSTGVHLHYGLLFVYRGREEWLNPIHPPVPPGSIQ